MAVFVLCISVALAPETGSGQSTNHEIVDRTKENAMVPSQFNERKKSWFEGSFAIALEEAIATEAELLEPKHLVFALLLSSSVRNILRPELALPNESVIRPAFGLETIQTPSSPDETTTVVFSPSVKDISQVIRDCRTNEIGRSETEEQAELRLLDCLLRHDPWLREPIDAAGIDYDLLLAALGRLVQT